MAQHLKSINEAYDSRQWHDSVENSGSQYIRKKKRKSLPKYLPKWIQILNAKLSGIKTYQNEKPIIGLLIYIWLISGSLSFSISRFWYMIIDIQNPKTPSTFFNKSFEVILTLIWCSMGVYAHKMTFYIFSSPSLLSHIRVHTRSFLGFNSALLIFMLVSAFCGCNLRRFFVQPSMGTLINCTINDLPNWMCYGWLSLAIYFSIPAVYFNLIVYMVILSIMRTHTIVLRRQVSELEQDGKVLVRIMKLKQKSGHKVAFQLPMIEIESLSDNSDDYEPPYQRKNSNDGDNNENDIMAEVQRDFEMLGPEHIGPPSYLSAQASTSSGGGNFISVSQRLHNLDVQKAQIDEYEQLCMPIDEIIYRYRFLFQRALTVSLFFQRWMLGWLFFVVVWTISYVVEWINSQPNDWQIILLILPILIFWIIASGYAEVNNEAARFTKAIYPIQERVQLIRFITTEPIQVGIFSVGLTYTTMVSIVVAMGVAIISKIVIDEVKT